MCRRNLWTYQWISRFEPTGRKIVDDRNGVKVPRKNHACLSIAMCQGNNGITEAMHLKMLLFHKESLNGISQDMLVVTH